MSKVEIKINYEGVGNAILKNDAILGVCETYASQLASQYNGSEIVTRIGASRVCAEFSVQGEDVERIKGLGGLKW